jgi:hypothetical protein
MKIMPIKETNLEECVKQAQRQEVVLTRDGKPIAILVGVEGLDLEQVELGHSDEIWELIKERRAQPVISREELEQRLADS